MSMGPHGSGRFMLFQYTGFPVISLRAGVKGQARVGAAGGALQVRHGLDSDSHDQSSHQHTHRVVSACRSARANAQIRLGMATSLGLNVGHYEGGMKSEGLMRWNAHREVTCQESETA